MKKLLIILCFCSLLVNAQTKIVFKPLRYEENWKPSKSDSTNDWYHHLKYSPIGQGKRSYISVGGEIRYQYLNIKNEDWGDAPSDGDGYLLTRYLAHLDFHLNTKLRAFVQIQSSLSNSRPEPSLVEENPLDLHQAFIHWVFYEEKGKSLLLSIGRQELMYGSQRLIAVREGPNNRLAFDGIKSVYQQPNFKADVFYSHPVANKSGIFDDHFNENTKLWGFYSVLNHTPLLHNIDVYYLGYWKRLAAYDIGKSEELRHSIGTRIWKNNGDLQYDFEGVFQFGSFGEKTINAWTLSSNTTYKFSHSSLKPKIGLKTEAISGEGNRGDNTLQTFNPLFPRGAYFGLVALIGPSNLLDIHPSINVEISKRLDMGIDYDIFWRLSTQDGIYAPNMSLIYSGKDSKEQFIGTQLSAELNYQLNPFVFIRVEGTWFNTGEYLKTVSAGKNVLFMAFTTQIKF